MYFKKRNQEKKLLSIYSYYKMLAIFPALYNTFLSHLTPNSLYFPFAHLCIAPLTCLLVTTNLFSISVSLLLCCIF